MRYSLLSAVLALSCAAALPRSAELARLEAAASASPTARRLFAATRHAPRRDVLGPAAEADGDAQILLVLAAARAELEFPMPVVEAEHAAWQKTLLFCVELAAEDPRGFGALLAGEVREQGARETEFKNSALPASSPWAPTEIPVLRLPSGTLARAALLLHLFERDPQDFYWAVEAGSPWPAGSVRLAELEDLFALRARDIAALASAPAGPYAALGGKSYPGALVRAAFRLRGTGEVERLRESLEAYDTAGLAALRAGIARWRRAVLF